MTIPKTMISVQLTGHGGFDKLVYNEETPVPAIGPDEVLIQVFAAGVNNTDINTRIGWYAAAIKTATAESASTGETVADGDWTGGGLKFPRIQGTDICGVIVAVGADVDASRCGQRVLVQSCLRSLQQGSFIPFVGSERDGGFAQYVSAPAADTFAIRSALGDAALAAIPCAYGTAENLLHRTNVQNGERVLITGASGNVGIAAIQLAKRRGAHVIAVAAQDKHAALKAIGADECISRDEPCPHNTLDVVIDVVGGPHWPTLLDALKPAGRYGVSGAIAGPIVELDLRKLYLKDLTFFGCTAQAAAVFPNLISYLERGEISPVIAKTYALKEIRQAQEDFLSKAHIGKIILVPPRPSA